MPTPRQGYSLNGAKVPGVTTVIGKYKDPGGLMYWVWKCGRDGLDYKQEGRNAANIGTATHDAIERAILNQPQEEEPTAYYDLPFGGLTKAKRCFSAWKRWNAIVKPTYEHIEPQLVHDIGFGGTIDAIGLIGDTRYIIDWKTSNDVYDETALQVAAYSRLWECNTGEHIDHAIVLRMDKKEDKFEQFELHPLADYYNHFTKQLDLYNDRRRIMPPPWVKKTEKKLKKEYELRQKA